MVSFEGCIQHSNVKVLCSADRYAEQLCFASRFAGTACLIAVLSEDERGLSLE